MSSAEKEWARRWQQASVELAQRRRQDLRAMTDEQARASSDSLLSLALSVYVPAHRRRHSGLVEQQTLFDRLRRL